LEEIPTIGRGLAVGSEFQHAAPPAAPLVVVAAALLDSRGRVLMQRRPEGKQHGGLWEFPGGKVEAGESTVAALVREIEEELCVTIAPDDAIPLTFAASEPVGDSRAVVLLLYVCRRWHGEPVCEPGAGIAWADAALLDELPMPPLDVPLAAALKPFMK